MADPLDRRIAGVRAPARDGRRSSDSRARPLCERGPQSGREGPTARGARGVVTVVPPALLTQRGQIMAATLACGPGTAASHRAGSALFELRLAMRRWIDVTTPGSKARPAGYPSPQRGHAHRRRRHRHRQHPVHNPRPHPARHLRGRDAARGRAGTRRRRAATDPRHARHRRCPRPRQRTPWRQAAARGPRRTSGRQHAHAQQAEEAFSRSPAPPSCRPTPSTSGSPIPTAVALRPTSSGAGSASSSKSTAATSTPRGAPFTATAGATSGSCARLARRAFTWRR